MSRGIVILRAALLGVLVGTLAACATTGVRDPVQPGSLSTVPEAPAVGNQIAHPSPKKARSSATAPAPDPEPGRAADFWTRIVDGFRFGDCDAQPAVAEEAKRYVANGRFADMLKPMLPQMALVLDEVERRGLPTEFVLLPIIESHYRALPARGNRPAGVWQMMPGTARIHGLEIRPDYDARLDLAASTRAALDHIERLADRFADDWTAVVKAYNAGEYRVRRARSGAGARAVYRGLSGTTLTHHARLHALACVIAMPERFGVKLPEAPPGSSLAAFAVTADLDLDLAAAASGIERQEIVAANPGIRGERAPRGSHLVLTAAVVKALEQGLEPIPAARRAHWSTRESKGLAWENLAQPSGLTASALAAANGATVDDPPPARIVVPGTTPMATTARIDGAMDDTYVVRAGDSPWAIARRLRVRLADLLSVNGLTTNSVLQPGQRLRIP